MLSQVPVAVERERNAFTSACGLYLPLRFEV